MTAVRPSCRFGAVVDIAPREGVASENACPAGCFRSSINNPDEWAPAVAAEDLQPAGPWRG
jgi:hypothetical protein